MYLMDNWTTQRGVQIHHNAIFEDLDNQICENQENKEIWEIMKYKENKEILYNILKNQEILISKEKSHPCNERASRQRACAPTTWMW